MDYAVVLLSDRAKSDRYQGRSERQSAGEVSRDPIESLSAKTGATVEYIRSDEASQSLAAQQD
jgi:hypothetical protein